MNAIGKVRIVEVGMRDGLQNEPKIIPTSVKVEAINSLIDAGLHDIEFGAFVHPKLVPAMADTNQIYSSLHNKTGVRLTALVPNMKGLERAIAAGVKSIAVFTAASETFNKKNINMSIDDSLTEISDVCIAAHEEEIEVRGYVSTVWHCPYEGKVDPARVLDVTQQLIDFGCYEVSLGDTIGRATPTESSELLEFLIRSISVKKLAVHFHDTLGNALKNIEKSLLLGVKTIDSSVAGLGGCPFAPGAPGNVSTESVLGLLSALGVNTGINKNKIKKVGEFLRKQLR